MVKELIKLDYALSKWFAGKRKTDRVIPGTVYFFSTKIAFLGTIVLSVLAKEIGIHTNPDLIVVIGTISAFVIMKVLEKPVKQMIQKSGLEKEYRYLKIDQIYKRRTFGLFLLATSLYSMILILIILFK